MKFNYEKYEEDFNRLIMQYSNRLKSIYGDYAYRAARLIKMRYAVRQTSNGPVLNEPYLREYFKSLTKELAIELQNLIESAYDKAIKLSYIKYLALTALFLPLLGRRKRLLNTIKVTFDDLIFVTVRKRPDPMRLELIKSIKNKTIKGFNLSDRIWKLSEQFEAELIENLRLGVLEGASIDKITWQIKHNLKEPNRLYRRIRNAKGKLIPSKPMSLFHPGRGVYRSSYKNALRLVITEMNSIYREADHIRWKNDPKVLGFEVKLSNNHKVIDICDHLKGKYPKQFLFRGWHPQCFCYAIPIILNEDDFFKYLENDQSILKPQRIKNVPSSMLAWVHNNNDKILNAKSKMFFIDDNFKIVNGKLVLKTMSK